MIACPADALSASAKLRVIFAAVRFGFASETGKLIMGRANSRPTRHAPAPAQRRAARKPPGATYPDAIS